MTPKNQIEYIGYYTIKTQVSCELFWYSSMAISYKEYSMSF